MSLRLRLVLLVLGLVGLVLGGLGLYLGESLDGWALEGVDRELLQRASVIAGAVKVDRGGQLHLDDDDEDDLGGMSFRITDATGAILAGRGLGGLGSLKDEGRLGVWSHTTTTAEVWRVLSKEVRPEHPGRLRPEQRPLVLTVAAPARRFLELSSRFRFGLLVALALSLLLGGGGAALLAQLVSSPLRRLSGELAGLEARSLDRRLTTRGLDPDLTRLADTLNRALDRLEAAFRHQKELVARASHALRTPLAAITTTAEVSARKDRSADEYKAALGQVVALAMEAKSLVEELLLLSRADVGKEALTVERIEISDLEGELFRLFAARASDAGLSLQLEVGDAGAIQADRQRLMELLEILLDNAIRYTPRGGHVGLLARAQVDRVALEVWDTGLGIAEDERVHVFERFFRGQAAEATGQPGHGLGLSIVRAIADAHGAELSVLAKEGGGTRMVSLWPRG